MKEGKIRLIVISDSGHCRDAMEEYYIIKEYIECRRILGLNTMFAYRASKNTD